MRKILRLGMAVIVAAVTIFAAAAAFADTDPLVSGWTAKRKITVKKGMFPSDQANFPVLISIPTDPDLAANALSTGNDICFTASDGITRLKHEVEKYVTATGQLVAWVKLPAASSSSDNVIYMFYGNSSATDQSDKTNVWDANYNAVWHMNDTSGTTVTDSTGNYNGTKSSSSNPAPVTGKDDGALDINNDNSYVQFNNPIANSTFTLEFWFNLRNQVSYDMLYSNSDNQDIQIFPDGASHLLKTSVENSEKATNFDVTKHYNEWHHFFWTHQGTATIVYIDGQVASNQTDTTYIKNDTLARIGKCVDGGYSLTGTMDEVRVSNSVRSADWAMAEFNNQSLPDQYIALEGPQKSWLSSGWSAKRKITISHTMVANTDQTNFPVLVSFPMESDLAALAKSNGTDILFTSSDGVTKLPHEIEKYDSTTGQLIAWVKVPQLSATTDTVLYMYYGNASAADQSDKVNVWNQGFKGVWHLKDDPTTGGSDSVSSPHNSTTYGTWASNQQTAGQIDGSWKFNGSDDNAKATNSLNMAADYTYSFWMKLNTVKASGLIANSANTPLTGGAGFNNNVYLNADGTLGYFVFNNASHIINSTTTLTAGGWYHVTAAMSLSGSRKLYVNGVLEAQDTNVSTQNFANLIFSFNKTETDYFPAVGFFDGQMDEVHFSSTARSADWIKTEYNNQSAPLTYVVLDPLVKDPISYGWTVKRKITVKKGMFLSDQVNFPVLVSIPTDPDLRANAKSNGYDILFTSSDGQTKLKHEIEKYDNTTGQLVAWVKLPAASSSSDNVIYMFYGNSSATDQSDKQNVWDSNYKGVWHLGNGTTLSASDSSFNANNGTVSGPTAASGQVDGAASFDGVSNYATLTNSLPVLNSDFSVSFWVDPSATANNIVVGNTNVGGMTVMLISNIVKLGMYGTGQVSAGSTAIPTNQWSHVTVTYTASTQKAQAYINGVQDGNGATANFAWTDTFNRMGGNTNFYFAGALDEVKISNKIRSADWIRAEYNNQAIPDQYVLVDGPVKDWTGLGWKYKRTITVDHTMVANTDQTNFPLLISLAGDTDLQANAKSNGYDIVFTGSDGRTKLSYEIEK